MALWVAITALICKELLFRYMLAIAKKVKSSLLIANAWHARSDAASSFVVALGILGNLAGYPILDPIAALIVGLMIAKMGFEFSWTGLHDLMDKSANEDEIATDQSNFVEEKDGILGLHQLRTRKMGDMIIVDVHLEVSGEQSVKEGHRIAVEARNEVLKNHNVIDVVTHIDPI